ncbi:zinc finger BED domain-containing protein RICESLEEPER 2-like [Medicago truncatula]|uniref:zinc finger BED domain-containing protein RICESLEEPER 2-like n=1 Tax=Medicago truncatula TaxID=3880 RepID=UPI000D2F25AC|nr:zinc finger BED domain-containing protein RICESLEEPER 2-like [Medicago truncatula]XP_024626092.1 zinc finger BED domain-containing protein RICESLEEPER 2-like [Medicago truncatula]
MERKKWQCLHCKRTYVVVASGSTSHLKRHLREVCLIYKKLAAQQQKLNLKPTQSMIDEKLSGPLLMNLSAKYDHERQREAIAHWVMMHEHPFSIVEEEGFLFMMKCSNFSYEEISRKTLKNECVAVYESERKKLKSTLRIVNKICLTTDLWKSQNQKIEYMVLTGHFIDADWVLQKRVLGFVHVPPPRHGVDIADAIFKCLKEWGIENKIFSVSVDNAYYNDRCLKELKVLLSRHQKLVLDGKLFHVRCCAHILNLLVEDGIGRIREIVEKVHDSVRFINQSEARLRTFSEIVQQLKLGGKKLILDCPTRWNSTYQMLSVAMQFKEAFPHFQDREPSYTTLSDEDDWEKVEKVCKLLEVFNFVTHIIYGSEYPTSNLYLTEVFQIKQLLDQAVQDESNFMKDMANAMKEKFDKYWSQCNLVMSLASVLDPRIKMMGVNMCFPLIYPGDEARKNIEKVHKALNDMYLEYVDRLHEHREEGSSRTSAGQNGLTLEPTRPTRWSKLMNYVQEQQAIPAVKSEVQEYLNEPTYKPNNNGHMSFCALEWWKLNSGKYKVLSHMATDVLAISISTVASESTFSAGGRVIDYSELLYILLPLKL